MGRKRVISEHQVLDAAERVVVTKGAGRLTIEAVALQAGISKATVLYYYKTKRALIQALVDRIVSADVAANEAAIDSLQGEKDAAIRGRILAASSTSSSPRRERIEDNICGSVSWLHNSFQIDVSAYTRCVVTGARPLSFSASVC